MLRWIGCADPSEHNNLRSQREFERDGSPRQDLHHRTGGAVERKGCRRRVGPVPGAVEAGRRTEGLAGRERTIIREVGDCDTAPALSIATVPELRDRLTIGKRELQ